METYKKIIEIIKDQQKEEILKDLYFIKKNTSQQIDNIFFRVKRKKYVQNIFYMIWTYNFFMYC